MAVEKLSVSFPEDLAGAVRQGAREAGQGVSTWLAQAASARLRADALQAFVTEYEREHGAFTAEELEQASRELGLPVARPAAEGAA